MTPHARESRGRAAALATALACAALLPGCSFFEDLRGLVVGDGAGALAPRAHAPDAARDGAASQASPAAGLCAGEGHTCALESTGEVLCWGRNTDGQLGDGTATDRVRPVRVVDLDDARELACGTQHTCARRVTGAVVCWGRSAAGQLGNGSTDPVQRPVAAAGIDDAVAVSAGRDFSCVLRASGVVSCFGRNAEGQLGDGTTNDSLLPMEVVSITDAAWLASGDAHSCVVRRGGRVSCWGRDTAHQLGRAAPERFSAGPVDVEGLAAATAVAAGGEHTCAITEAGVACWGRNDHGQVGDGRAGADLTRPTPELVMGISRPSALSLGPGHSCAIGHDGALWCWGANAAGQLGAGPGGDQVRPVAVPGLARVASVAAGTEHTCAVRADSQVFCWGAASRGQLGHGDLDDAPTPQPLDGTLESLAPPPSIVPSFEPTDRIPRVVPHLALGSAHLCTVTPEAQVACFGAGDDGRLGSGSTRPLGLESGARVPGVTDAEQVAAYGARTCVRRATGQVACWGASIPALGLEAGAASSLPVPVAGVADAAEVVVGGDMACARLRSGGVACWGGNANGQLGNGTRDASAAAVRVLGLSDAVQLAAGQSTVCARRQTGTVACWGSAYRGALGSGAQVPSTPPAEVPGLAAVTDIDGASNTFCVVHDGGRVSCWGGNEDGQLGNGRSGDGAVESAPVAIASLRNVVAIGLGGGTACAVLQGGAARCWGANDLGQTGHGAAAPADVIAPWDVVLGREPAVAALGRFASMDCGGSFCCAIHETGSVSCQGSTPLRAPSGHGNVRSTTPFPLVGLTLRAAGDEIAAQNADVEPPEPPAADAGRPRRPGRPTNARERRPGCSHVTYHACRIEYDRYGRPTQTCACNPAACCPGGRTSR